MLKISGEELCVKAVLCDSKLFFTFLVQTYLRYGEVYFSPIWIWNNRRCSRSIRNYNNRDTIYFIVQRPIIINICGVIGQLIHISACVGQ